MIDLKALIELLKTLTDEQRMEVFSDFCKHCGCIENPESLRGCQCWNDE